jgi:hypothetical protein
MSSDRTDRSKESAFVILIGGWQLSPRGVKRFHFPTSKIWKYSFPIALPTVGCQTVGIFIKLADGNWCFASFFVAHLLWVGLSIFLCAFPPLVSPFLCTTCSVLQPVFCWIVGLSSFLPPYSANTRPKFWHPSLAPTLCSLCLGSFCRQDRGKWGRSWCWEETKPFPLGTQVPDLTQMLIQWDNANKMLFLACRRAYSKCSDKGCSLLLHAEHTSPPGSM